MEFLKDQDISEEIYKKERIKDYLVDFNKFMNELFVTRKDEIFQLLQSVKEDKTESTIVIEDKIQLKIQKYIDLLSFLVKYRENKEHIGNIIKILGIINKAIIDYKNKIKINNHNMWFPRILSYAEVEILTNLEKI